MIAALQVFLLGLCAFFLLSLIVGLIRPVLVLWFLDRFNRRRVITFYGSALLGAALALGITAIMAYMAE